METITETKRKKEGMEFLNKIVAKKLNRNYTGFELNPKYKLIAENRLIKEVGLFL